MRVPSLLASTVALAAVSSFGCTRTPPAGEAPRPAEPMDLPPPVAKETPVRVAAATEEAANRGPSNDPAADAGAPSLAGKTVLHVGDSMAGGSGGLTKALEPRFTKAGARFVNDAKESESIASFERSTRLQDLIAKHDPDVVLVTLGSNDALLPYPRALAGKLQSIAERVGARPCYWLGPPLWKPDTGIVAVLRENVAPCRLFDASKLDIKRQADGVHPSGTGGAVWAAHFWKFFEAHHRKDPPGPTFSL